MPPRFGPTKVGSMYWCGVIAFFWCGAIGCGVTKQHSLVRLNREHVSTHSLRSASRRPRGQGSAESKSFPNGSCVQLRPPPCGSDPLNEQSYVDILGTHTVEEVVLGSHVLTFED